MKDWIPLIQSLIWPVLIVGLVIKFRSSLHRLADTITSRVSQGASFEAGASGVRLGPASPQTPSGPEPEPGAQPVLNAASASAEPRPDTTSVNTIHLAHTARREKQLDRGNYQYHGIHAFLVGDDDRDLDRVTKVVYHLHPTFYEPNRIVTDRKTDFALRTAGWGMFNLTADVHLEGRATPLRLERYINF
ncbi:pYEATS domain-containing protein [Amycolatopsis japonica]|uniref:YEATS domain-containing protein n=1 Tax=Amycolatopsis japonica TaxID=208439 RepID=A0A075UK83_9PSEU|nr:pYEATS domain-containing protein [Amycolatopsis japonica]AIG73278.1 Hypothetical protein AJAP_01735 [Amycolatopsis japonica]